MSDIFLSYGLSDLGKAERLRAIFEQQGWTVSWGPLAAFAGFDDRAVNKEIKGAKVVVALWPQRAAQWSPIVRGALIRMNPARTVHVLLDKGEPYLPVGLSREFDLSDWAGDPSHAGLRSLLRHVRTILATPTPPAALPASIEALSLSEIQENARRAVQEATGAQPGDKKRFGGVFISYRRNEAAAYAGRLYDRLAARFGKGKVFIDTENVGWGEDFVEVITSAAESCAVMIALISPRWSRGTGAQEEVDDYVRLEVAKALERKIRVIPILIQGASMSVPKELPEDLAPLARRNALALSDTRWERDVEDLMKTLEGLLKD